MPLKSGTKRSTVRSPNVADRSLLTRNGVMAKRSRHIAAMGWSVHQFTTGDLTFTARNRVTGGEQAKGAKNPRFGPERS